MVFALTPCGSLSLLAVERDELYGPNVPPSIPALAPRRSSVLTKSQIERRALAHRTIGREPEEAQRCVECFFSQVAFRLAWRCWNGRLARWIKRFRAAFLGVFLKFDLEPSLLTARSARHRTSGSPLENRPSAGAL